MLLVDSPQHAGVLLRNTRSDTVREFWASDSRDGGANWSPLRLSGFPNPDAAPTGVVVNPDNWLAASNCNGKQRDDLCLMHSDDKGVSWQRLTTFHDRAALRGEVTEPLLRTELSAELRATDGVEDEEVLLRHVVRNKCRKGDCEFQYDYPYMIRLPNGDLHLVYTWNKSLIRHLWWRAVSTVTEVTP